MKSPLERLGTAAQTATIELNGALASSLDAARDYLISRQQSAGYWVGELEADTTLESDYILLEHFLQSPRVEKIRKAAQYLLDKQLSGGGWNIYEGGPANISATVKAYFALKLAGWSPYDRAMEKARAAHSKYLNQA